MRKRTLLTGWSCVLLFVLLLLGTRLPTLTHEMRNHPDEHVFVQGSSSLADALLGEGAFTETKPYPEGAYFFFLPAQLLTRALPGELVAGENAQRIANRLSSVVYFALGVGIGSALLRKAFSRSSGALFGLILLFSLFQIEQSRYGTGEALSFFLLMLSLYLLYQWLRRDKILLLYLSAACIGFLGAVKYPLILFSALPLWTVLVKEKDRRKRLRHIGVGICVVLLAFLLLSPGIVRDPRYLLAVTKRELNAYMGGGNQTENGGVLNHLLSVCRYWFFYADLLLAPLFALVGWKAVAKTEENPPEVLLFRRILPSTAGVFLLYNLFVRTLFMRTLYPFFAVAALYTAIGLDSLLHARKPLCPKAWRRWLCAALVVLTMGRTVLYVQALLPDNASDRLDRQIALAREIVPEGPMIGLATDKYITGHKTVFAEKYPFVQTIPLQILRTEGFPTPRKGEIVITGPLDCGKAMPYVLPLSDKELSRFIDAWQAYRTQYSAYRIGQVYPAYYGWLFGFRINGVISEFDFPMNSVYAFPE